MTTNAEAPAGTGASDKDDDLAGVDDNDTAEADLDGGCVDRGEAAEATQEPLPCGWTLGPERLVPDRRSSPVQWAVYLRSLGPDVGIWKTPSEVVEIGRSVGFDNTEIAQMLATFTASWRPDASADVEPKKLPMACPTPERKWGINVRTGEVRAWWADCRRWRCPVCGRKKTAEYMTELHADFDHTNGAWVGEYPYSEAATARIRQRRARARGDGGSVLSRAVRIGDEGIEISSAALTGSDHPTTGAWITPDQLTRYVRRRLDAGRGEGVRIGPRVGWPDGEPCEEESPRPPSDFRTFGKASYELQVRVIEAVRETAVQDLRVDDLDEDWMEKVPVDWLAERLGEVWAEVDAQRRGVTGWE